MHKGLLLLSGGIDSPVAGYLAKEAGTELYAIHFSAEKIVGNEPLKKSIEACKILGIKKIFVADISEELVELTKKCEIRYYFLLSKRLMMKIAEKAAKNNRIDFLITGENLGQVSSQTLPNLGIIDKSVQIFIARPLLCFDKLEIIKLAEKIGTFEVSKGPELCDALGPKHPVTKGNLAAAEAEESKIDFEKTLGDVLENLKEIDVASYQP